MYVYSLENVAKPEMPAPSETGPKEKALDAAASAADSTLENFNISKTGEVLEKVRQGKSIVGDNVVASDEEDDEMTGNQSTPVKAAAPAGAKAGQKKVKQPIAATNEAALSDLIMKNLKKLVPALKGATGNNAGNNSGAINKPARNNNNTGQRPVRTQNNAGAGGQNNGPNNRQQGNNQSNVNRRNNTGGNNQNRNFNNSGGGMNSGFSGNLNSRPMGNVGGGRGYQGGMNSGFGGTGGLGGNSNWGGISGSNGFNNDPWGNNSRF